MSDRLEPVPLPEDLGLPAEDWQQTPLRVRMVALTRLKRLTALASRLRQNSSNSSRPPSTDSPSTQRQRRPKAAERRQAGAKPGHPGHPQVLCEPTATVALLPDACACGHSGVADLMPSHTPQVIALPSIRPEVTHGQRPQGWCLSCGKLCTAPLPAEPSSGYGPRGTRVVGEMPGIVGASRSAVQVLCAALFGRPLRTGALQKLVERVSEAILPHDTAIGDVARMSPVHSIAETSWLLHGDRQWLWGMAHPAGDSCQIHPPVPRRRSSSVLALGGVSW